MVVVSKGLQPYPLFHGFLIDSLARSLQHARRKALRLDHVRILVSFFGQATDSSNKSSTPTIRFFAWTLTALGWGLGPLGPFPDISKPSLAYTNNPLEDCEFLEIDFYLTNSSLSSDQGWSISVYVREAFVLNLNVVSLTA